MKIKFLFLILFVLGTSVVFSQEAYIKDILETADAGYMHWLQKIPKGKESLYGFKNRDEFSLAKIGKPYQIFILSKEFYTDTLLSENNYIVPADEWRVSLTVDNESRVFVTVAKMHGIWKVVGIGAASLANELGEFEKINPQPEWNGMILRILPLDCELILIPSKQSLLPAQIYFLASANMVFNKSTDYQTSYSLKEVLLSVKNKIENK